MNDSLVKGSKQSFFQFARMGSQRQTVELVRIGKPFFVRTSCYVRAVLFRIKLVYQRTQQECKTTHAEVKNFLGVSNLIGYFILYII